MKMSSSISEHILCKRLIKKTELHKFLFQAEYFIVFDL